jgi:hypothetical protein
MRRAHTLIGEQIEYFTPHDLYLLCVSILLHDVGNLHKRRDHEKKVAVVYHALRNGEPRFNTERTNVLAIVGAHRGSAKDGSTDTLGDLANNQFLGNSVKTPQLAAVLRFADELEEGPHRTSAYMLNHGLYQDAAIFHKYANISDYCSVRNNEKIQLTYDVSLELTGTSLQAGDGVTLADLLEFSYHRIIKVDEERKYCKHYCDLLSPFKETSAWFRFWLNSEELKLDLKPLVISDLVIPGEGVKKVEQIDGRYDIATIVNDLTNACGLKL